MWLDPEASFSQKHAAAEVTAEGPRLPGRMQKDLALVLGCSRFSYLSSLVLNLSFHLAPYGEARVIKSGERPKPTMCEDLWLADSRAQLSPQLS